MSRDDKPHSQQKQSYQQWRRSKGQGHGRTGSTNEQGQPASDSHRVEPQSSLPDSRGHHDTDYQQWHKRQTPEPKDDGEPR